MFIQFTCALILVFFLVGDLRSESADTRVIIGSKAQAISDARETHDPEVRRFLDSGDFDGALDVYRKRLRTDPTDSVLKRNFTELKNVIRLRQELVETESSSRRNILAGQLRRFYLQNGCYQENVVQALKNFDAYPSEKNALFVIEAYDFTESYQESIDFIDSLDAGDREHRFLIEKCRLLLLDDRRAEAVKVLQSISAEKIDSHELLCRLSRLQALTGQNVLSVKTLRRGFELMPVGQLEATKREVRQDPAYRTLASDPDFAALTALRPQQSTCTKYCPRREADNLLDEKLDYTKKRHIGEIDLNFWRVR